MKAKISPKSNEKKEFFSALPAWIKRGSALTLCFSFFTLLFVTKILEYDEKITAAVIITVSQPPTAIIALQANKVEAFLVKNQQMVKTGDPVVLLQSTAKYADILSLERLLIKVSQTENVKLFHAVAHKNWQLGSLQPLFNQLLEKISSSDTAKNTPFESVSTSQLNAKSEILAENIRQLYGLEQASKEQYQLSQKRFKEAQKLYSDNKISQQELEKIKTDELAKEQELKNAILLLDDKKNELAQLQNKKLPTLQQKSTLNTANPDTLNGILSQLTTAITAWKSAYLLAAPADGAVAFAHVPTNSPYIAQGDTLFSITSVEKLGNYTLSQKNILGVFYLPPSRATNVKIAQRVLLTLDNYPSEKYSYWEGEIVTKTLIKNENQFAFEVTFSNIEATNFNEKIMAGEKIKGTCQVMTEKKQLLAELFKDYFLYK